VSVVEKSIGIEASEAPAYSDIEQLISGSLCCTGRIDPALQSKNKGRFV